MNRYRHTFLILCIALSLVTLVSSLARVRARAEDAKAAVPMSRSGGIALTTSADRNCFLDRFLNHAQSPDFTKWTQPFGALTPAGLTFTVNSTADPGTGGCDISECTLREAITAANLNSGLNTIAFAISGPGPHTIKPTSALPAITNPVIIDGYTQAGTSANTLAASDNAVLEIELDGSNQTSGLSLLEIDSGSSTVRGLVINHGGGLSGIRLVTNGGNIIDGNFLGTNVTGEAAAGNNSGVDIVFGSSGNLIGGITPAARNLISGNFNGLSLGGGPGNLMQGNFIGTDHTGLNDLGNRIGIQVVASNSNTIGGSVAGARNVISGNGTAIRMQSNTNVIQGNYIGISPTGGAFNSNHDSLIALNIFNCTGNTIGGTTAGARNVISGHTIGISLNDARLTNVQGNFIGTDATGTTGLGNSDAGIDVTLSNNTLIGGTAPGSGNLISANTTGIRLTPSTSGISIQIQGNLIGTDVTGTVDLGNTNDGVSINDPRTASITIGGTAAGARNVISGNDGDGVDLRGIAGVLIQGNFIGTQIDGTSPLGNGGHGINIVGAANTTIGGATPGAGNRIAFNGVSRDFGGGIIIEGNFSDHDSVRGNSIFANTSNGITPNGGLGIDLSISGNGDGTTVNDACDRTILC
ncbi:MAG: hypothetical protein DMF74_20870 [Acidobacteria bacterium]|nr:MAG: hypothetical protein DMF74_20870 [Acidobacteriota bacterium]